MAKAGSEVAVEVRDDGVGFQVETPSSGFGLAGIRERVYLAGGTLALESGSGGTVVRARLPARARDGSSAAQQTAS
jgi:signal transduction histidine kinase